MAGPVGFEPTNVGTKTRCLTTWRRPNAFLLYHQLGKIASIVAAEQKCYDKNMKSGETAPSGETSSWDMSDVEFQGAAGACETPEAAATVDGPEIITTPERKYNAMEEMQFWCQDYNDTEAQFAVYTSKLERDGSEDSERRYRITLRRYEEDAGLSWRNIQKEHRNLSGEYRGIGMYELADAQAIGKVEPHETIEAASSIFYEERMAELQRQIEDRAASEKTVADMSTLKQTWKKVLDYIDAKVDYDLLHDDPVSYQNARRMAHNSMIKHLNAINDLAREYGTTPFTLRNFMTNDFRYDSRRDKRGRLNHRAEYDRESVLSYFRSAFRSSFDGAERRANNRERLLGRYY